MPALPSQALRSASPVCPGPFALKAAASPDICPSCGVPLPPPLLSPRFPLWQCPALPAGCPLPARQGWPPAGRPPPRGTSWPVLSGWRPCVRWLINLSCVSLFCELKLLAFCGGKLVVTVATY